MRPPLPYRLLSRLAPASFRRRHEPAITAHLDADLRDHRAANRSACAFWARASCTLALSLPGLWLASLRRGGRSDRPTPRPRARPMETLLQDLRFAARGLLARPGVTFLCVLAIALGIGANATVFTLANEIFLRPVPVHEPSRLVDLHVEQPGANSFIGFSYPEYEALRGAPEWDDIAATSGARLALDDDGTSRVSGQFAAHNHLPLLGVEVAAGRLFGPSEDAPGAPLVAVVSHGFWQRRLGGGSDVVGRVIELDEQRVTIIGVLAPPFQGRFIGFPSEIWLPLHAIETFRADTRLADRGTQPLELIGRLAPEATLTTAGEALDGVAAALEEAFPEMNRDRRVALTPYTGLDSSLRAGVLGFLGILGTLSALVLMAACLNVGNLLLARGQARAPEFATRLALGGSRFRIVRQVLTETTLLFGLGALAATAASMQLAGWLRSLIGTLPLPLGLELRIDWTVLALTGAVALATALATGCQPALRAAGAPLADVLRTARSGSRSQRRLRQGFVAAQVAVSVVLLLTAGLFLRALEAGTTSDPGLDVDGLRIVSMALDADRHTEAEASLLLSAAVDEIRTLPGIERAALAATTPIGVARTPIAVLVPGVDPPAGQDAFFVDHHVVGAGYLPTTGIPLVGGRDFDAQDDPTGAPVAMVNRSLARLFWADGNSVGEQLLVGGREVTVVGVVEDTRHLVQSAEPGPLLYLPFAQEPRISANLLLRSAADIEPALRETLAGFAPAARIGTLRPQRDLLDTFLLPQRIAARTAGGLGVVGLLLALTGVYGMVAFAVAARRREMGIRMALGAAPAATVGLLLRSALLLVAAGAGVGLLASLPLGPLLGSFLLGVSPLDPLALVSVFVGLLVVALAAAWLPARRAATIDPASSLRAD